MVEMSCITGKIIILFDLTFNEYSQGEVTMALKWRVGLHS